MIIPGISNSTLVEATYPLSFEDFVSQQFAPIAKYAYEQAVTRNRKALNGFQGAGTGGVIKGL